jgi:formylglycine-generating enzyme
MKKMFRTLALFVGILFLSACGKKDNGQLTGSIDRPNWKGINPYGMVYVPSGTLHIGPSDQDVPNALIARQKSISIQGFFMDDTEITNNEYRQFMEWVRDSIGHDKLGHKTQNGAGEDVIDWSQKIDWAGQDAESLFYGKEERFAGKRELNTKNLKMVYEWYDWKNAAYDRYRTENRKQFLKTDTLNIYPDTLVWVRDFTYSYNEPMTRNYFWHPAFDDYPVVGVSWRQANAFCYWRTNYWNKSRREQGEVISEDFRLPIEGEWEYAARGGHDLAPYPWGGYYTRNAKGCLLANFKPGRGNYPDDGGLYTVKADAYFPNDYGLYNMAGNVAEWTSSAFFENGYHFQHDLNPDIRLDAKQTDPEAYKRKVTRGGSWKDIAYFIQTGTRNYEFQDTTKSYIGFRCVLTFLGRSMNDFN